MYIKFMDSFQANNYEKLSSGHFSKVLSLINSTFTGNRATEGGGVYIEWKQSLLENGTA